MRKSVLPIFVVYASLGTVQGQYSRYYNVDINQNIKANVDVTGNVYEYKTIRTIDYGALSLANAQRETNRLEIIKYEDEKDKRISLEIASDPSKAYDYGTPISFTVKGKDAHETGLKSFNLSYMIPHKSLFVNAGAGRFENLSQDGIITELFVYNPLYNKDKDSINVEQLAKWDYLIVGQINKESDDQEYVLKKDIDRVTVCGIKGYKTTVIGEDNYQYSITDYYLAYDTTIKNGILYSFIVRTYGNKKGKHSANHGFTAI